MLRHHGSINQFSAKYLKYLLPRRASVRTVLRSLRCSRRSSPSRVTQTVTRHTGRFTQPHCGCMHTCPHPTQHTHTLIGRPITQASIARDAIGLVACTLTYPQITPSATQPATSLHTRCGAGADCCCACGAEPSDSERIWSCRILFPNSRGDDPRVKWPTLFGAPQLMRWPDPG